MKEVIFRRGGVRPRDAKESEELRALLMSYISKHDVTQLELSRQIAVTPSQLNLWLNGKQMISPLNRQRVKNFFK